MYGKPAVKKVERRGISLKLTCNSEKQRDVILGCTELGNVSVIPSLPYGVTRQLEDAACTKIHRVVITGVPTDVDEESIRETTGAVEVRRILKRVALSDVRTPTTAMILGFCGRDPGQSSSRLVKFQNPGVYTSSDKVL